MENLQHTAIPELMDLLAEKTAQYTKMLSSEVSQEEFDSCKDCIKALQREIESRQGEKQAEA